MGCSNFIRQYIFCHWDIENYRDSLIQTILLRKYSYLDLKTKWLYKVCQCCVYGSKAQSAMIARPQMKRKTFTSCL